jgi:hypothetical protein
MLFLICAFKPLIRNGLMVFCFRVFTVFDGPVHRRKLRLGGLPHAALSCKKGVGRLFLRLRRASFHRRTFRPFLIAGKAVNRCFIDQTGL